MGDKEPTVVLMSEIASWSPVWYKTQTETAKSARVCALDRASYGYSDPAPLPQVLPDAVMDLRTTLKAAEIPAPDVLAGHSPGGLMEGLKRVGLHGNGATKLPIGVARCQPSG